MNIECSLGREWVAAYYPSELMENDHTKTIACLLFDRVVCHFPIAHMGCGGGAGVSDVFGDDSLVEEGVIELREEFLCPEVDPDFRIDDSWGTEEQFGRYIRLNVTAMALSCCQQEGHVPVTDAPETPVPAFALGNLDLKRSARIQATAAAVESLRLVVPPFAALSSEEILAARDKLRDELKVFRIAMLSLAPKIRSGIESDASLEDIGKEATYVAETDVYPAIAELDRRLKLEKGVFWRRILQRTAATLPQFAVNWITGRTLAGSMTAVEAGTDIALAQIERDKLVESLRTSGGLGFLLSVSELKGMKPKGE